MGKVNTVGIFCSKPQAASIIPSPYLNFPADKGGPGQEWKRRIEKIDLPEEIALKGCNPPRLLQDAIPEHEQHTKKWIGG